MDILKFMKRSKLQDESFEHTMNASRALLAFDGNRNLLVDKHLLDIARRQTLQARFLNFIRDSPALQDKDEE